MTIKKQLEILALVNGIRSTQWNTVREIVDCFNGTEPVEVIKKEWQDYRRNHAEFDYSLNLSSIVNWVTYDNENCIDLLFTNKDNKLHCLANIYDGSSLGGVRLRPRFSAEFILPDSFFGKLEKRLYWALDTFTEEAYKNHLEAQKKLFINNLKAEILNDNATKD